MRYFPSFLALIVLSLFAFSSPAPASSKLLSVVLLSRHGTRAPNPEVEQLCSNDKQNLEKFLSMDISLAGLTGKGMTELYELGVYTRQKYIEGPEPFLSQTFDNKELYIRAVGEDRTLQSAVAWGQALYGPGHSAVGYYRDLPAPLPVYTIPDEIDNLLEVRKAACKDRLKDDVREYDSSKLVKLYADNAALIAEIGKICGRDLNEAIVGSGENLGDAVKDITDAFTFDIIEGFTPIAGLTLDSLLAYRRVAVDQLIGRILGEEDQITYLNGALPSQMRESFLSAIEKDPSALKFYSYHGHREMIYAVGKYYGIEFDIEFPGLPKGAVPPATTLFFELHENESASALGAPIHTVHVYLWIPCNGNAARQRGIQLAGDNPSNGWERIHGLDCPAQKIQLNECKELDCTWEEFLAIEENRIKKTGTWESLCDYEPETSKLTAVITEETAPELNNLRDGMSGPIMIGLSAIGFCIVGIALLWRRKTNNYEQII